MLSFGLLAISASFAQQIDPAQVLSELTVEEKAKLVVGAGMKLPGQASEATVGATDDKVAGAAGTSQVIEKHNLSAVVFADGPAGVRISPTRENEPDKTFYATAFPVATSMAATFNLALMEEVGAAFGHESKEYGVDILLSPALNLHRNPLGGRNFEYYSEDPVVSGKMAAAFVNGLQSQNIGASIKHFAANNLETNRTRLNTIVSERAMRELYLKGFEIALRESDPWTVMSSYNKINGTYASESKDLLQTILRDEWGYEGFVMTDWFAGEDVIAQMQAGNDLIMPGTPEQETAIIDAVNDGKLEMAILDENVLRILKVYAKTNTFQDYEPSGTPDLEASKSIARKAAAEGIVLLKNEQETLPVKDTDQPLAILGVGAYQTIAGGTGSGDVNKAYGIDIFEGLQEGAFNLSAPLAAQYNEYIAVENEKIPEKAMFFEPDVIIPEMNWETAQLDSLASTHAAAIYTLSRTSGEFQDRELDDDFQLSETEKTLIKNISSAFRKQNKPLIVLLNIGGVIETDSWKDNADAIVAIWQGGQEAGHAVADVLSGRVNPSGKLPMTFPISYEDDISAVNFPGITLEEDPNPGQFSMRGIPSEVVYEEGIYIGYRYFETFDIPVAYPFGHGLSYSSFSYEDFKVEGSDKMEVNISFTIQNTGEVAGKTVGQIYVSAPDGQLDKPAKELKAFVKTEQLEPGASQTFNLALNAKDLAAYSTDDTAWILEKGTYTFSLGSDIKTIEAQETIAMEATITVFETQKALTPENNINELKAE